MKLKKISENVYEIPKEGKMLVPGRIYASEKLMESIKQDKTFEKVFSLDSFSKLFSHIKIEKIVAQYYKRKISSAMICGAEGTKSWIHNF